MVLRSMTIRDWQYSSLTPVLDLAGRFADGRLSTEKLLEADDEALYEMLTAVRGIGKVRTSLPFWMYGSHG